MKTIILLFTILLAVNQADAQPPKGKAKPGTTYGAKITAANAVSVSELPAMLKKKDTVAVKVRGIVKDVCAEKGCWMTLKVNDSTEAFIKMKNYGFFVPVELEGRTVVVEGTSFVKNTSVGDLKHYAEDAKKSQAEIDAITAPKKEIRLVAKGILVTE